MGLIDSKVEAVNQTVNAIVDHIINVDKQLKLVKSSISEYDYDNSKLAIGQTILRLRDALSMAEKSLVTIQNIQRSEVLGFGYQSTGSHREVKKSSSDDLVTQILRGGKSYVQISEATKPKARNQ